MKPPQSNQGFVLPIAIGVGLIAILLGVMIIARSSQNRLTAIAQKDTARSLAVAEAGVTQLQALFSQYRPLAIYCTDTALSGSCNSGRPAVTWQTVSNAALDPCGTTPGGANTLVQSYANQSWHNINGDPSNGEFRLMSYKFTPDTAVIPTVNPQSPGTGELMVEGWINRSDSVRTSKSRLKINFRVSNDPGASGLPGLWIQSNSSSGASGSVQLKTNIRDSTCPSASTPANVSQLKAQQPAPPSPPPYSYQDTSGDPFPVLPVYTPPPLGSGSYAITAPIDDASVASLPKPGESRNSGVLSYHVSGSGPSINLTAGSTLSVGTGEETVVLYLDAGMTVTGGSKIQLVSGSKLIIYANGPVTLEGGATENAIKPLSATPKATDVQIYVYPPTPPVTHQVALSSNPPTAVLSEMPLFLFAPESDVTSSGNVKGFIWAKSWKGENSAVLTQDTSLTPADLVTLKVTFPARISPITAWQREPVPPVP